MPAVTYLSDHEVREGQSVANDKDCDELLQELRQITGENWIIRVHEREAKRFLKKSQIVKFYTLYADCHGEWQIINLVTPEGGSLFHASENSRQDVMNFMLGYVAAISSARAWKIFEEERLRIRALNEAPAPNETEGEGNG